MGTRGIVLFGAGAGGDPERYGELLEGLQHAGLTVLAPVGERLDARTVTPEQLRARAQKMKAALDECSDASSGVILIGHSICGAAALCLAGAQPWARDGQPFDVPTVERATQAILLAPSAGWFGAPGAMARVRVPVQVFAGSRDSITPPGSADILRSSPAPVDITVLDGAGHFDFMSMLPPGVERTAGIDRAQFVGDLVSRVIGLVDPR